MTSPPWIDLRVDELALEGFSPGDARRVALALERELNVLMTRRAKALARGGAQPLHVEFLSPPPLNVAPGAPPAAIGKAAARAIAGALEQPQNGGRGGAR